MIKAIFTILTISLSLALYSAVFCVLGFLVYFVVLIFMSGYHYAGYLVN